MSSKIMLGLLVSAAVGLGATVVSADENVAPEYNYKKAAVIKDNRGKKDDFCKVPIRIKGDNVVLASDDARVNTKIITYKWKKFLLAKCDFKDKVDFYYYRDIKKTGFKCEFENAYDLTTRQSLVIVDFDRKWGRKGQYKSRPKHVVAKVHLECLFELPRMRDNNNNNNDDKDKNDNNNNNKHDDNNNNNKHDDKNEYRR
jgi:hypothetical protein